MLKDDKKIAELAKVFDQYIEKRPDGAWRDKKGIDVQNDPTFYHGMQTPMTDELKARNAIFRDFTIRFGRAYRQQFADTYFDSQAKIWMTSIETPVDIDGKHLATIGHDVLISELMADTINQKIPCTTNMVFRDDGRLIVHPSFMTEIEKAGGAFKIQDSKNDSLKEILTWKEFKLFGGRCKHTEFNCQSEWVKM